jgi:hypothetical protein
VTSCPPLESGSCCNGRPACSVNIGDGLGILFGAVRAFDRHPSGSSTMGRKSRRRRDGRVVTVRDGGRCTAQLELDDVSVDRFLRVRIDVPGRFPSEQASTTWGWAARQW